MTRKQHTKEELRSASDHLFYEIQMLQGTMNILATGTTGQSILSNALIESFTIHARALMHFLYPLRPHSSDVLAEDFFQNDEWETIQPAQPDVFEATRGRVNKEIAHLTYDRQFVPPELKGWGFVDLGNTILEIISTFLKAVPKQYLGSRWNKAEVESVTNQPKIAPAEGISQMVTDVLTPGNV